MFLASSPTGAHFFNELPSFSPVISVTERLTKKLNHNLLTFLGLSESPTTHFGLISTLNIYINLKKHKVK